MTRGGADQADMSQSQGTGRSTTSLKKNKEAPVAGQGARETLVSGEAGQKR